MFRFGNDGTYKIVTSHGAKQVWNIVNTNIGTLNFQYSQMCITYTVNGFHVNFIYVLFQQFINYSFF